MASVVLNRSLVTGLGRPDLAYAAQGRQAVQTGVRPVASVVAGDGGAINFEARSPLVALFILVLGLSAFAFWVHPHLA